MKINCVISLGELVDKISILRIKKKFISDNEKLSFIDNEDQILTKILNELKLNDINKYMDELIKINTKLWKIEDDIRIMEREQKFDQSFIDLARSVYLTNDERFKIKNQINEFYFSDVREVKSYKRYD